MSSLAYPVIFEKDASGYYVTVPDLDKCTQGNNIAEAIVMARDVISLWLLELEEEGKNIPVPNSVQVDVPEGAFISYVDVNMEEYRRKYGTKIVKKNCSIPAWLNTKAEELGINFSKTLQEALMEKVNV